MITTQILQSFDFNLQQWGAICTCKKNNELFLPPLEKVEGDSQQSALLGEKINKTVVIFHPFHVEQG